MPIVNRQSDLSIESCIQTCTSMGNTAAGMEYANECSCDNQLSNAAKKTADSECNMACAGNSNEKCGAG